jgi:hypothetical protein
MLLTRILRHHLWRQHAISTSVISRSVETRVSLRPPWSHKSRMPDSRPIRVFLTLTTRTAMDLTLLIHTSTPRFVPGQGTRSATPSTSLIHANTGTAMDHLLLAHAITRTAPSLDLVPGKHLHHPILTNASTSTALDHTPSTHHTNVKAPTLIALQRTLAIATHSPHT